MILTKHRERHAKRMVSKHLKLIIIIYTNSPRLPNLSTDAGQILLLLLLLLRPRRQPRGERGHARHAVGHAVGHQVRAHGAQGVLVGGRRGAEQPRRRGLGGQDRRRRDDGRGRRGRRRRRVDVDRGLLLLLGDARGRRWGQRTRADRRGQDLLEALLPGDLFDALEVLESAC